MVVDELIVPEYCVSWHERVERVLKARFTPDERFELHEKVMLEFDEGMCSQQTEQAVAWMNDCVQRTGLSRSELAQKMGVDRAHIGRWLTGENDLPFRRLQRFHVLLGLRVNAGMPLKECDRLHFSGYIQATRHLHARLRGLGDTSHAAPLDLETLLCVYHFYATTDPLTRHRDQIDATDRGGQHALIDVRQLVEQYVTADAARIRTPADLAKALSIWGEAWLICLRLLAEEEDGVKSHYVTAKRGIRLLPVNRGELGT